jgi:hypothetical protein
VVRQVLRHHLRNPDSPLRYITTDMIDMADYGENAKYSLFDQNVAIATWIRKTWDELVAAEGKASSHSTNTQKRNSQ